MSGDGERRIDYHVFELEIDAGSLCEDWYVMLEDQGVWKEALIRDLPGFIGQKRQNVKENGYLYPKP
jgi:hypothetical protein